MSNPKPQTISVIGHKLECECPSLDEAGRQTLSRGFRVPVKEVTSLEYIGEHNGFHLGYATFPSPYRDGFHHEAKTKESVLKRLRQIANHPDYRGKPINENEVK